MKTIIVIFITLIAGFFSYISFFQQTVIYDQLSLRAQEYIKGKKNVQDSVWQQTTIDNPNVLAATTSIQPQYIERKCFNIRNPFPVTHTQETGECNVRIFSKSPKVTITVVVRPMQITALHQTADIQMRRNKSDVYTEKEKTVNGHTYLIFKKETIEYEKTAFTLIKGNVIAITLSSPSNRNFDAAFNETLSSVEYLL